MKETNDLDINDNTSLYYPDKYGKVDIETFSESDGWVNISVLFDDLERWVIATRKQLIREGR